MKGSKISSVFGLLMAFLLSLVLVNAVQDFSVSPSSFSQDVMVGNSGNGTFTIQNTGDEAVNLTLIDSNLERAAETIALTLNSTSIQNLAAGATRQVFFSYSTLSSNDLGTYTGTITVRNTQNTSQQENVSLSVNVQDPSGAEIELANGEDDETFVMDGELGERISDDIRFRNIGEIDLTNIQISITDLEGENSGDDIDKDEVDFDEDNFDLDEDDSIRVEIEIDIPDDIQEDTYIGTITLESSQGYEVEFVLELEVSAGNMDVSIVDNRGSVRSGILTVVGESGEVVDDFTFFVENDADFDVNDLEFELDGDLEEEFTSRTIDESAVSFSPSSLDLNDGEADDVEVTVRIPSDQPSGNYYADLRVLSSSGDELDEIALLVRVIGDVYISSIELPEEVSPGEDLLVDVTVRNQQSRTQRDVQITGTIEDIDPANSDLTESTSTFILDVREERTETLRFRIPDDATDGSHTLEITLEFGDEEVIEIEEVNVVRPARSINVESFSITPSIIRCDESIFTFMKVKNLGRFDEDVVISAEIKGTGIKSETGEFELNVDEISQRNLALSVSDLEPGTYTVSQRVSFAGQYHERESTLTVYECDGGGVIVNPINDTPGNGTGNQTGDDDTYTIFGQEVGQSTVYLASGVGVVLVLIIVALFMI